MSLRQIYHILGLLFFCCSFSNQVYAHEIRPAYLEINQVSDTSYSVTWKIPKLNNRIPKISPLFPKGFILNKKSSETLVNAQVERFEGIYHDALSGKEISIDKLPLTLVDVMVKINLSDGITHHFLLQPSHATKQIPVMPNKFEVFQLYTVLGIEHILIGIDHLLFILGLLLLIQNWRTLLYTITAFTLAHSITLGLSTLGLITIPQAPIEAIIALSIVFLAREYIMLQRGIRSLSVKKPWIVAFAFGLLHGLGFAGVLSEIGLPQKEVPLALLTFNIGIEIGQIIFIAVMMLLLALANKMIKKSPSYTRMIPGYALGIIATFWVIERVMAF